MNESVIKRLEKYITYNEQERKDKELILEQLRSNDRALYRDSTSAHVTVSAWVVNEKHDKVLMAYHNIYDSWAWLGGHADGEQNLLSVAIKEACEESGVKSVRPLSDDFLSIEVLTVNGHIKRGEYISSHLHLNFTYLLEASELDELTIKQD